jgi:hypothetical protein
LVPPLRNLSQVELVEGIDHKLLPRYGSAVIDARRYGRRASVSLFRLMEDSDVVVSADTCDRFAPARARR